MEWKYVAVGLNSATINRKIIHFEGELNNMNILENSNGKSIVYYEDVDGFTIITDDPCHTFLNEEDINSIWTKYPKSNIEYCIENALIANKNT